MFVSIVETDSTDPIAQSADWVPAAGRVLFYSLNSRLENRLFRRGDWSEGPSYERDAVSFDGQIYIPVANTISVESPEIIAFRELLARRIARLQRIAWPLM